MKPDQPHARGVVGPVSRSKQREWRLFAVGLGVRLGGVGLLWVGDGGESLFRRALVVLGVILSIGGLTVLRYLLLSEPLSRVTARMRRDR